MSDVGLKRFLPTEEDKIPGVYIYAQEYKYDNRRIERIGFISLMKLEMENKKTVLPHENTLKAPKADRLNLMRSVKANLSPIFMLYKDDEHERFSGAADVVGGKRLSYRRLKIGIMGCIVNGPGEMADADFGYVERRIITFCCRFLVETLHRPCIAPHYKTLL